MHRGGLVSERSFTYSLVMERSYSDKLKIFYERHKRMPSYSEFARLYGFKSKNAAHKLVLKFEREGIIEKDRTGKLLPGRTFQSLRVLGTVEAGWPSPAEEELLDTMTLDEFLISNKEATYMLTVKGESMIDAGILPGDLVLVERVNQAKDGEIVIAEVDGDWTMKYFKKRGKEIYLEPANKKFSKITPKETLKIAAVVKAVIRKY